MITKNRLIELLRQARSLGVDMGTREDAREIDEILELAVLGFWSKHEAVPALKAIAFDSCCESGMLLCCDGYQDMAKKALLGLKNN